MQCCCSYYNCCCCGTCSCSCDLTTIFLLQFIIVAVTVAKCCCCHNCYYCCCGSRYQWRDKNIINILNSVIFAWQVQVLLLQFPFLLLLLLFLLLLLLQLLSLLLLWLNHHPLSPETCFSCPQYSWALWTCSTASQPSHRASPNLPLCIEKKYNCRKQCMKFTPQSIQRIWLSEMICKSDFVKVSLSKKIVSLIVVNHTCIFWLFVYTKFR